ncbi:hypothetical protein [Hymenobacter negativus]|uniref:Lipoprotein n=1 Tax=Hymenobacter negativus TaxID=2795026 RepID=A0ABS3Q9I4_9BACT|nr:hypothetical protein [Hymenobacter negativus]MBO2007904.1 hypothetical protein [Hymenobacter negativus]
MSKHLRYGAFFFLMAGPLFMRCGEPSSAGHDIQALELLHFNGQNETWVYRMDSVGRVQALYLNAAAPDSAVHCFALSEPQRRQVLTLAQQVVRLDSIGTGGIRIEPTDGAIVKVLVYRKGQRLFSYGNAPVAAYADPQAIVFHLAQALREAGASPGKPSPCVEAFSAPVLAQGLEDLFHFPRPDTLPKGAAQE